MLPGQPAAGAAFPACAPIAPAFLILGLPGRALAGSAGGPGCLPAGARFPARSGNGGDVVQGPRGALVAAPGFQRARPVACLPFSPIHGPASPALGGISPALPRQVGCLAGPSWRAYVRFVRAWPLPDCDEALASSLLFLSPTAGRPGCVIVSSFVVGVCASKGAPAVRFLLCASELSVWFVSSNEKVVNCRPRRRRPRLQCKPRLGGAPRGAVLMYT
ncbi:unnamed protein product [Amoebophrya sp. A120]|nr:unnamed protein product [Amoebophrya sp. A120]|eukprot:GSA120T00023437001.1